MKKKEIRILEYKAVVVIVREHKANRGKEIAQGGHGFEHWAIQKLMSGAKLTPGELAYIQAGHPKIVLQIETVAQAEQLYLDAINAGLQAHKVIDSGRTYFHGVPTLTCVHIGPDLVEAINKITGSLNLY